MSGIKALVVAHLLATGKWLVGDAPVVLSLLYRLQWTPIGVLVVASGDGGDTGGNSTSDGTARDGGESGDDDRSGSHSGSGNQDGGTGER